MGAAVLVALVLAGSGSRLSPVRAETFDEERKTTETAAMETGVAGQWRVEWIGQSHSEYIGLMSLTASADGVVTGQIKWRLTKTPREDLVGRIESTGVEYVRGTFARTSGLLIVEGTRKDDPDEILGLDRYRLLLSPNGQIISGMTENGGNWLGRFWAFKG
jgi:hypothetical protein